MRRLQAAQHAQLVGAALAFIHAGVLPFLFFLGGVAAIGLGLPGGLLLLAEGDLRLLRDPAIDLVDLRVVVVQIHLPFAFLQFLQLNLLSGPVRAWLAMDPGRSLGVVGGSRYAPGILRRREDQVRRLRQVDPRWQSVLGLEFRIFFHQVYLITAGTRALVGVFWRQGGVGKGGIH